MRECGRNALVTSDFVYLWVFELVNKKYSCGGVGEKVFKMYEWYSEKSFLNDNEVYEGFIACSIVCSTVETCEPS